MGADSSVYVSPASSPHIMPSIDTTPVFCTDVCLAVVAARQVTRRRTGG
jgi:hypothetical protein